MSYAKRAEPESVTPRQRTLCGMHADLASNCMRPLTQVACEVTQGEDHKLILKLKFYDRDGLAQVVAWPTNVRGIEKRNGGDWA